MTMCFIIIIILMCKIKMQCLTLLVIITDHESLTEIEPKTNRMTATTNATLWKVNNCRQQTP